MVSGIYYLIARNIDTNEKVQIELTNRKENRYCTVLSNIDKLTTQFDNKEQLIEQLYNNKYINFKNADIYIEYQDNGIKKFLELLYKPSKDFSKLTPENESTIKEGNPYFQKGLETFFNFLNKRSFREYIKDNKKLLKKLRDDIEIHYKYQYRREAADNIKAIISNFYSYKVFRDFTFTIQEYLYPGYAEYLDKLNDKRIRNYIHKKEQYVEEVNEHESDDEFLTEEEIKTM